MKLPILQVDPADLPAYAIVCGDPFRAEAISRKLTDAVELAFAREYRTFVGEFEGVRIAVTSHGVGAAGAAVCFEELIQAGVRTLIRVGTAGTLTADYPAGGLIVSTAAVREEGLTRQLVPLAYPAVADGTIADLLHEKAVQRGGPVGKGITVTVDAFYSGVEELPLEKYKRAGALAVEMEISALYVVASLRGARAGAIVALDGDATKTDDGYDPHKDLVREAVNREIDVALATIAEIARREH